MSCAIPGRMHLQKVSLGLKIHRTCPRHTRKTSIMDTAEVNVSINHDCNRRHCQLWRRLLWCVFVCYDEWDELEQFSAHDVFVCYHEWDELEYSVLHVMCVCVLPRMSRIIVFCSICAGRDTNPPKIHTSSSDTIACPSHLPLVNTRETICIAILHVHRLKLYA